MNRILVLLLVASGLVTLMLSQAPGILFYAMLFPPLLALLFVPTFFLWLAAFLLFYLPACLMTRRWVAALVALPLAYGLLWALPQSAVGTAEAAFARAMVPDVGSDKRLDLRGDVLISLESVALTPQPQSDDPGEFERWRATAPYRCEALCAALLATEGVSSVTVTSHHDARRIARPTSKSRTFRMLPRARCPANTVLPLRPEDLAVERRHSDMVGDRANALRPDDEWNLRMTTHCIVEGPPLVAHDLAIGYFDFTDFAQPSERRAAQPVQVDRLIVTNGSGAIVLRKSWVRTEHIGAPLQLVLDRLDGPVQFRRDPLSNLGSDANFGFHQQLADHSNLHTGADPSSIVKAMRDTLADAISRPNPPEDDPAFNLAGQWLASLKDEGVAVSDADIALLQAMIADRRVISFAGMAPVVKKLGERAAELRGPIGRRLASDTPADWMPQLAWSYGEMPPMLLAKPTEDEAFVLADPDRRALASTLIVRQADRGAAATPYLVATLRYHARRWTEQPRQRGTNHDQIVIGAVRAALCPLGPSASAGLAEIDTIIEREYPGAFAGELNEWNFTRGRLGKPLAQLRKWERTSWTIEENKADVERRLANFDPVHDCIGG